MPSETENGEESGTIMGFKRFHEPNMDFSVISKSSGNPINPVFLFPSENIGSCSDEVNLSAMNHKKTTYSNFYKSRYHAVWFLVNILEDPAVIEDIGAYSSSSDQESLAFLLRKLSCDISKS